MINSGFTRGSGLLEGYLARKRAELVKKIIPQKYYKGRILDVGCGTYPFFLETSGFSKRYGIDYSTNTSLIKDKSLIIKKTNVEKGPLPFETEFFDVVVMLAVFEHINKHRLDFVLKQVKRVVKKDGLFLITTPSPWSDPVLHFVAKLGLISSEEIHDHKHNLSHKSIVKMLVEAGFESKKIKKGFFELGFNMWICAKN